MATMKIFNVYLEDLVTETLSKSVIPAFTEKEAIEYVNGNGDLIAVKEAEDIPISSAKLLDTLERDGWGKKERLIIIRALSQIDIIQ